MKCMQCIKFCSPPRPKPRIQLKFGLVGMQTFFNLQFFDSATPFRYCLLKHFHSRTRSNCATRSLFGLRIDEIQIELSKVGQSQLHKFKPCKWDRKAAENERELLNKCFSNIQCKVNASCIFLQPHDSPIPIFPTNEYSAYVGP